MKLYMVAGPLQSSNTTTKILTWKGCPHLSKQKIETHARSGEIGKNMRLKKVAAMSCSTAAGNDMPKCATARFTGREMPNQTQESPQNRGVLSFEMKKRSMVGE